MTRHEDSGRTRKDTARLSLMRLDREVEIDRDFVAREAGDVPLPDEDREEHERVRRERGSRFFADLLFVLTHTHYEVDRARTIWERLLAHKQWMTESLGRNPCPCGTRA